MRGVDVKVRLFLWSNPMLLPPVMFRAPALRLSFFPIGWEWRCAKRKSPVGFFGLAPVANGISLYSIRRRLFAVINDRPFP